MRNSVALMFGLVVGLAAWWITVLIMFDLDDVSLIADKRIIPDSGMSANEM